MTNHRRLNLVLPWILAVAIVALDRATKVAIQQSVAIYDTISVIPGMLRIVHTENPGAAFGMLAEGGTAMRAVVLIGISILVFLFVLYSLWNPRRDPQSFPQRVALGLILGGAFGNLYDRLARQTVTDFVELYHRAWSFPAFNVADSAITVGAALILLDLLRRRPKKPNALPELPKQHAS